VVSKVDMNVATLNTLAPTRLALTLNWARHVRRTNQKKRCRSSRGWVSILIMLLGVDCYLFLLPVIEG
jgi:hypothetical protein